MGLPNLVIRGSIYWWRRKVSVTGHPIPINLSLHTGFFHLARVRAAYLSAELEKLRMAYGERGVAIDPATLKKVFTDALRWQLERILTDQTASGADPAHHAQANRIYAELWRIFARVDPRWTPNDDERLAAQGWSEQERRHLAALWEQNRDSPQISVRQLDAYRDRFGFEPTSSNLDKVRRTIFSARTAACKEATKHLGQHAGDLDAWVEDALADSSPFAFDDEAVKASDMPPTAPPKQDHRPTPTSRSRTNGRMLLKEAARECIRAHQNAKAWSANSVDQVNTAIKLFDYACGGDVMIEDLTQAHVEAFYDLCARMPNRWGKTKAELEHGIPASLRYAEQLKRNGMEHRLGFSSTTLAKHRTWIHAVLEYADDDGGADGHRPAVPLRLKTKRTQIGDKQENKRKRARDKRANWTRQEIGRLLDAPIWSGCEGLDLRFKAGTEIFHDAWYWLPLMYILYGGRSSELAGLGLAEVHEGAEIPYFKVDYNDLRGLKNVQSIRKLPIHPELIRLGFINYVTAMREAGHSQLFPEMVSPSSQSFASTFYKAVFNPWRKWAFPNGTEWRHEDRGQIKDKDVHSFRGVPTSMMKGKVADSVRVDILGHEGEGTTARVYDEEAELEEKLKALELLSPLTRKIPVRPLRLRPPDRQRFGARPGRRQTSR